jgi:hypothetical protein
MMKKENKNRKNQSDEKNLTRKEALKKVGKYAAFTGASMLLVLSPKEAPAQSPGDSPRQAPRW